MKDRRRSRECALQLLFQTEFAAEEKQGPRRVFWERSEETETEVVVFAEKLLEGVLQNRETIDVLITKVASNWKIHRMPAVDRNVLRLAVYELMSMPDVPVKVTMNEAIEIAKKFGTEESGAFVNGILDKIAKELKRIV